MKNGELILVNEISPGFEEREITTVRIKELTDHLKEMLSKEFPETDVQFLPNGSTLIDVRGYDSKKLGNVVEFLKVNEITEFSFGKVTLNDLYSMYYQEG